MIELYKLSDQIILINNQRMILDRNLAKLYGVETRVLKQSVRRNIKRFPEGFMYILNKNDMQELVSQNVIPTYSSFGGGLPMAFTEFGVAMLSSILSSDKAIEINIQIIKTFIKLRENQTSNEKLNVKLEILEKKYDSQIKTILEVINRLAIEEEKPKNKIGFDLN